MKKLTTHLLTFIVVLVCTLSILYILINFGVYGIYGSVLLFTLLIGVGTVIKK
jgi:hypothetical protein